MPPPRSRAAPPSSRLAAGGGRLPSLPSAASASVLHPSASAPVLQWLPPAQLGEKAIGLPAAASSSAEEMVMASWLQEFRRQQPAVAGGKHGGGGAGKASFGSSAVFIELQLRQALAATQLTPGKPDAFRTACVCECLSRLPEAAGHFSGVLSLLRQELLRSIYVDFDRFAFGGGVDARVLLERRTYAAECDALRAEVAELKDKLDDWRTVRDDLARDSDARNELLRLAAGRWNSVLGTIREANPNADQAETLQETSRKLSALLDSMRQHSAAIDELQRLTLLDPEARAHAHVHQLRGATKRKVIRDLLATDGAQELALLSAEERVALLQGLFVSLELSERQELLRGVATHEGVVGGVGAMATSIADGLTDVDADALAAHLLKAHAARQPSALGARRALDAMSRAALAAAGKADGALTDASVQAGAPSFAATAAATQTDGPSHGDRAEYLAEVAAEVGEASVGCLPEALEALSREVRWREAQRRVHAQQQQQQPAPGEERGAFASARRAGAAASAAAADADAASAGPDALPQEDARGVLLPLVKALDARCAAQEETIAQLRGELEAKAAALGVAMRSA